MIDLSGISSSLYALNRSKLVALLEEKAMVLLGSNDLVLKSGDQYFPFKQNADLFYLTGIHQPKSYLLLFPSAQNPVYKEVLFIEKGSDTSAIWGGNNLSKEEARNSSGITSVFWTNELWSVLPSLMHAAHFVYLNTNENDRVFHPIDNDSRLIASLKAQFPLHRYERLAPLLRALRSVKSEQELSLIQKACAITKNTFDKSLRYYQKHL